MWPCFVFELFQFCQVGKEYSDLPAHEQKLHNYYESFEKEGLPDVDQLIAGSIQTIILF